MLLQHKRDVCTIDNSIYQSDKIFQMIVKNLTPEVVYNANKELIDSFTQTLVNYSPISVNIIDYWNKSTDFNSAVYKPNNKPKKPAEVYKPEIACFSFYGSDPIHKGFSNFPEYVTNIPADQPTGLDPYTTQEPVFDSNGYPLLDQNGNPVTKTVPNSGVFGLCSNYGNSLTNQKDCGFYLNSIIGLQDKLAEIFMHNVYSIANKTKHNYVFRTRVQTTLEKAGIKDAVILDNINELFTEDRYIINGTWREKKGTEVAMKYAATQAVLSHVQPKELNIPFKWDTITIDPMTYVIEGSVLPSVFETFIKPLAHPISYIYTYKMVCEENFTEYIMAKKYESASGIGVITLCDSNLDPCCNPLNELDAKDAAGNYIHPYPNNPQYRGQTGRPPYKGEETFNCTKSSQSQYGRTFVIALGSQCDPGDCHNGVATKDCALWDKLDCEEGLRDNPNVLKYTEQGISQDPNYYLWSYKKYVLENNNYLIEYQKPNTTTSPAEKVIEYWRNGPIGYYPYAIWHDGWQASINIKDYKVWYETELADTFEVSTTPGRPDVNNPYDGARWFGFNDDPNQTFLDYPLIYQSLIPAGWKWYGQIPPGSDPQAPCPTDAQSVFKCDINYPNKGFANFGPYVEADNLDPNYLAGCFIGHPVNIRCSTTLEINVTPVAI